MQRSFGISVVENKRFMNEIHPSIGIRILVNRTLAVMTQVFIRACMLILEMLCFLSVPILEHVVAGKQMEIGVFCLGFTLLTDPTMVATKLIQVMFQTFRQLIQPPEIMFIGEQMDLFWFASRTPKKKRILYVEVKIRLYCTCGIIF